MVGIIPKVHSIDGLSHPIPTVGMVAYIIEEKPGNYTLLDTCFTCSIPTFESYLSKAEIDIKDINWIVLTHLHPDLVEVVSADQLYLKGIRISNHDNKIEKLSYDNLDYYSDNN